MAIPLSDAAVLAALRAEGVTVVEVGNWPKHNRSSKGLWGPVNGSMVHHSVTRGTASTVALCRDGHSALPGPLCHGVIAKDGRVHLVGWGRTNHAGGGDPSVLAQVIAESYGTRPSPPTKGNSNGVDGNARFYGWECENLGDGKDPWPAAQYDAIVRVQAALCRAHGWSAKSVIGHLEWSSDKIDPRGFGMPALRADVAERLTHPASWSPDDEAPESEEDTDMTPAQEALLKKIAGDVDKLKAKAAVDGWDYKNAALVAEAKKTGAKVPDMHGRIEQLQTTLDAVAAAVAELKGV
ncbi:peptidoglycan recognition protein family protein [Streptomyces sp. PpalLS-921]|uniref:peptidoglycan recognition protein family protein n=1 Tax=Streptomyces sp. PpalLS-921 TaxID=1839772 RepID=UPI00081F635F|nr:N-acetylmuramoyl-L-alanine amidase [Streptomyces sp. PpalLS-921]SCD61151.1 N-acetylmuramoyl-L-alanine amidase [Streptomyces sp. PpalLS-921]